MRSITGPSFKSDVKDVTSHSSPGRAREKLVTLKDPGSVKFEVNWIPQDPTQSYASGLLAQWANLSKCDYKLVLPDTGHTTWTFKGVVNMFETSEKIDDVLQAQVEITFVSIPTLA